MLSESDLVELLYQNKGGILTINDSLLDDYILGCYEIGQDPIFVAKPLHNTVDEALQQWNVPSDILALDLDIYFTEKVTTLDETMRVVEELVLYRERKMEPMLRFMIYLVRVMRENNIVWGVGRGSSVSSYLLFLIGLHSVDAVKYNLDIREFIR